MTFEACQLGPHGALERGKLVLQAGPGDLVLDGPILVAEGVADVGESPPVDVRVAPVDFRRKRLRCLPHDHQSHLHCVAGPLVVRKLIQAHSVNPGAHESDMIQDVAEAPAGILAWHSEHANRVP